MNAVYVLCLPPRITGPPAFAGNRAEMSSMFLYACFVNPLCEVRSP